MTIQQLQAENAHLKAEVERLEQQVKYWHIEAETDHARWLRVLEDIERLRKAGDDLYKSMLEIGCNEMADNFQYDRWWGSMKAWITAKEGKPSI